MSSVPTFDTPITTLCVKKEWTSQYCKGIDEDDVGISEYECNQQFYTSQEIPTLAEVDFVCDGQQVDSHIYTEFDEPPYCFDVAHHPDLGFTCRVTESGTSGFERESDCPELEIVPIGSLDPNTINTIEECTLTNNYFEPAVPTMDAYGLGVMVAVLVISATIALRKLL